MHIQILNNYVVYLILIYYVNYLSIKKQVKRTSVTSYFLWKSLNHPRHWYNSLARKEQLCYRLPVFGCWIIKWGDNVRSTLPLPIAIVFCLPLINWKTFHFFISPHGSVPANIFCKGPNSKYFWLLGPFDLLITTQLCHYSVQAAIGSMWMNGRVCCNKTLFTTTICGSCWSEGSTADPWMMNSGTRGVNSLQSKIPV